MVTGCMTHNTTVLASLPAEISAQVRRIQRRLLEVCPDVCGIILFGSLARREPFQDADLMVVVRGSVGWHERARILRELRTALGPDGAWVDLVVVSERRLRWGLEAHYPFYLDIAFDGVVLYDAEGIGALLEQAREEVTAGASGVRRREGGSSRCRIGGGLGCDGRKDMAIGTQRISDDLLVEVEGLEPEEQLYLLEYLAGLVRRRLKEPAERSLLELQGLGKETWIGVDAQEYVDGEREGWGSV